MAQVFFKCLRVQFIEVLKMIEKVVRKPALPHPLGAVPLKVFDPSLHETAVQDLPKA